MYISDIGETELIRRIKSLIDKSRKKALVGIGDDAAVVKGRDNYLCLFTTDTLVENVHFRWEFINPYQLGWKALAVNISDVAAMGGYPTFALVTLGLPAKTLFSTVEDVYRGIKDLSSKMSVEIIGGDMVHSSIFFITISLLGEVESQRVILRSGARPGNTIYITGDIGAAATGFICLNNKDVLLKPQIREFLEKRHLMPFPRLKEAREISEKKLATAMIDTSDGLSSDLYHILEESEVGAELWEDKFPLASETKEALSKLNRSFLDIALQGGEDYQLLFTVPSDKDVEKILDFPVTMIGRIVEEEGLWLVDKKGGRKKLHPGGWDHFSPQHSPDPE